MLTDIEKAVIFLGIVLVLAGAVLGWLAIKFFEWLPFTIVYTG